jgi:hypothetical protein
MPRKLKPNPPKGAPPPLRRVRYAVAMSLDGYIASPRGEAD